MPSPVSTRCPECDATLKLKSSAAIGKKVPCPKCGVPFVVKPLKAASQDDDFLDAMDDYGDDYSEESLPPVPRGKGSARKSSKKKGSRSSSGNKTGVIIAGVVVGVLLIAGIGLFASGAFSSGDGDESAGDDQEQVAGAGNNKKTGTEESTKSSQAGNEKKGKQKSSLTGSIDRNVELAYLPADTELLIAVRVGEIWSSPLVQSLVKNPEAEQGIAEMKTEIGLEPADIQSVIVGLGGMDKLLAGKMGPQLLAVPQLGPPTELLAESRFSVVVRTGRRIDQQKIVSSLKDARKRAHAGKAYYVKTIENQGKTALFFPDKNSLVFADEKSVKSIIESDGKVGSRPDLDFIDASPHFVLALAPGDKSFFDGSKIFEKSAGDSLLELQKSLKGTYSAVAFGVTVTDGIQLQSQIRGNDAVASQKIARAFKALTQQVLKKLAEEKKNIPQPQFQEILTLLEETVKETKQTQNGNIVKVATSIPGTRMETLAKLPGALFSLALMNSMGGAGEGDFSNGAPGFGNEPKPAAPIKAVDLQAFNESWQTNIDIQNQPAQAALNKLAGEMKLQLQTKGIPNALLNKKLTLELQKKSRLEAVETICDQIGIHPVYDRETKFSRQGNQTVSEIIRLERGSRPSSAVFAGPFLVALSKVRENVPHATGEATLQIVATNLPSSVLSRLRKNMGGLARIGAVEGSDGKSVFDNEQGNSSSWSQDNTANYVRSISIPLKNLLRDVTSIKTLSGQLKFDIPTEIKTLKFDKLTQGVSQKEDKLTVTIKRLKLQGQFSSIGIEVTGCGPDLKFNNVLVELLDADDKPLKQFGSGGFGSRGTVTSDIQFQGKPASATVKVISQLADMEYDFALKEIPLKESAKMPVKVQLAKFPGHETPLTLEFVKITGDANFKKVRFKVINHADKTVDKIDMTLNYLDAGGKKLKDFPSGYQGKSKFGPNGRLSKEPAVAKKGTKQIEVTAFFMPENTKTVKAELREVRFVDAEVWKPKTNQ